MTASPSFLCPTQALGLALQHHPILPVGNKIIKSFSLRKSFKKTMRHLSFLNCILRYTKIFLNSLSYCPTKGSHLRHLFIEHHLSDYILKPLQ
jgi:hypothetical protein